MLGAERMCLAGTGKARQPPAMAMGSGKPWFTQKRYGIGGMPVTWQGWAAIFAFVVALVLLVTLVQGWPRWVCVVALAVAFTAFACAKTEGGCRWRWDG